MLGQNTTAWEAKEWSLALSDELMSAPISVKYAKEWRTSIHTLSFRQIDPTLFRLANRRIPFHNLLRICSHPSRRKLAVR
jgi:hypothetical protein